MTDFGGGDDTINEVKCVVRRIICASLCSFLGINGNTDGAVGHEARSNDETRFISPSFHVGSHVSTYSLLWTFMKLMIYSFFLKSLIANGIIAEKAAMPVCTGTNMLVRCCN